MHTVRLEEEAKRLNLASIAISKCLRYGVFRSLFVGQGIDFDSCREYEPNDDIRYIDWNVTARAAKPFIKLYSEEHDISLFVIVDASDSMTASSAKAKMSYYDKAIDLASLFLFAGFHLTCQVGALLFADKVENLFVPKQGSDFVFSIVHRLKKFSIKNASKSNLNEALKVTSKILTKHSLVVLISDFKINHYEKKLSLLAKNNDVIAIRLFSENDFELPNLGLLPIYDSENAEYVCVQTSSKKAKNAYKKDFTKKLSSWENKCIDMGVLPCKISLQDNSTKCLQDFLMTAKSKYEAISLFRKQNVKAIE